MSKPGRIHLNGESYIAQVLLIHTKMPDGSPALMKRIADDGVIDLNGGEEFMIVYAPESMCGKSKPKVKP